MGNEVDSNPRQQAEEQKDIDDIPRKPLSDAAKRALAESEERRRQAAAQNAQKEVGGRDGPDPIRYGDWEKDGIISDF